MATIAMMLRIDSERVAQAIDEAREKLGVAEGELLLDFSSVARLTPNALTALKALADAALEKNIKAVLHGVNVEIYKVLKLANLAQRFTFAT